jgi:hypothetical protein
MFTHSPTHPCTSLICPPNSPTFMNGLPSNSGTRPFTASTSRIEASLPPHVPDPYTNRTRHHTPLAHPPSLLATAPQHYKTATTTLPSRYPTCPNPYRSQGTIALHASPQQRKTCRALPLRKPTAHRRHTCLVRRGNCATEAGKRRSGLRADRVRGRGGAIGIR